MTARGETAHTHRGDDVREKRRRLALGLAGVGALALLLSQAGRLPGAPGEIVRRNAADDRDAAALFYTEVNGWPGWSDETRPGTASASTCDSNRHDRAPVAPSRGSSPRTDGRR